MPAGRPKGTLAPTTPRLTPAQLDKMVELHDRYKLSYRAIGVRYGIGEKMAQRMASRHRKGGGLMGGTYDTLQRSVHSIAESLLDVAQIEGVESINIHVISDRRYGDGSGYISGFAVNGKRLLFDFCEIVGSDE